MEGIIACNNSFQKKLDEIEIYIQYFEEQKLFFKESQKIDKDEYIGLSELLNNYHTHFIKIVGTPLRYNSLIISLYGSWEYFLDNIMGCFFDRLILKNGYHDLPRKMKQRHISLSAEFILDPNRFHGYPESVEDVAKNLYNCVAENDDLCLNKNLFFKHSGNMNFKKTVEFLGTFNIENSRHKILLDYLLLDYLANKNDYTYEQAKVQVQSWENDNVLPLLDELIDKRNSVAHGSTEERVDYNYIKFEYIPLLRCLGDVLCDILLAENFDKSSLNKIETVYNVINGKILLINNKNSRLEIGQKIFAIPPESPLQVLTIKQLEVNHQSKEKLENINTDVGIEVNKTIKKNWEYYI